MYCGNCGTELPDDARFCAKCGKPIDVMQSLVDRAKSNDSAAQTELYERSCKIVYSRIRAKISDDDAVMDIMQEAYLRAFTNLDQLQDADHFTSWLVTIANRQACDWYRKNGKELENVQMSQLEYEDDDTISDEDDLLDQPEYREDFSPDESLDRAETGRLLSEILDTLPEDQRIILTMRYYDEMSLQEISDELGVNLSTVKSRLTAGKKKVEAKVRELEKSGTKLYSLGPVAFLVSLLHHAELFAPAFSANTIIGMTAAGAGGAAAGAAASAVGASAGAATAVTGAAAKTAAVGAAVKTAAAAAVKGLGVKAIAAIAAAAVVVGGGVTTAVVVANNHDNQETAEVTETAGKEEETKSEELAETEESLQDLGLPSEDTILEMADFFTYNGAAIILEDSNDNKWHEITFEDACHFAATAAYFCIEDAVVRLVEYNESLDIPKIMENMSGYTYVHMSEEVVNQCLQNLFGSEYHLSDYVQEEEENESSIFYQFKFVRSNDGSYFLMIPIADPPDYSSTVEVIDISPDADNNETCTAVVRYSYYYPDYGEPGEPYTYLGYRDFTVKLAYDDGSNYKWVTTAFNRGEFVQDESRANIIDSGSCGDNLKWKLDNSGTLTLSGDGELFVALDSSELPWYSYYDSITTLVIGKDVTSIDIQAALAWPAGALREIQVEDGNPSYCAVDGVLFSADRKSLLFYPKAKAAEKYTIPEGTTQISKSSFYGCPYLTSIEISSTVTSIDDTAFSNCDNLKEITFAGDAPSFGTNAGEMIFDSCFNGISATAYYPAENPTWTAGIMQNYGGNITWEPY